MMQVIPIKNQSQLNIIHHIITNSILCNCVVQGTDLFDFGF